VNAASLTAGPVAPGSLISIFGSNLSDTTELASATGPIRSLGGVTLSIGGVVAPLSFVSPNQINAQVPFGMPVGPAVATLQATGGPAVSIEFAVVPAAPGIFTDRANQAWVRNADGSLNTQGNPAGADSHVSVYVTGLGSVAPLVYPVTASIGRKDATVIFAGLSPESVGLYHVDLVVPRTEGGLYPLVITVNGVASNAAWISTAAYRNEAR